MIMRVLTLALGLLVSASAGAGVAGGLWDFTSGAPAGTEPGRAAAFSSHGMYPLQITNVSVGSGCRVGKVKLPEAFRFSAEFIPGVDWKDERLNARASVRDNVLFDNLYVPLRRAGCNRGMTVSLRAQGKLWTPEAYLGFGDDVVKVTGPSVEVQSGRSVRLSFYFDAARGLEWEFSGVRKKCAVPRGGPVAQSGRVAAIGERGCSNYRTFNGTVKSVAIVPAERRYVSVGVAGRASFVRGETNAVLEVLIEDFRSGKTFVKSVPVETRTKPGRKTVSIRHDGRDHEVAYSIGPRSAPRMPVVAWGGGPFDHVREMGFTHLFDSALGSRMPREKPGRLETAHAALDRALSEGIRLISFASTGTYADDRLPPKYHRLERSWRGKGVPKGRRIEPEVSCAYLQELARRAAEGNASDFGLHPALGGVLCNTERMDRTFPSFNNEDALYRKETGRDVPAEITWRTFSAKKARERFPDGIVPEDDPVLSYLRWWWKDGNGWPRLNSAAAGEYRKVRGRNGFFSFFDPAVRCLPCWGSGGNVDVISHWVYANPEPMAVAGPAESLFAMAKGREGRQDVMIMTQLICYRSRIAPESIPVDHLPDWVKRRPHAGFITIPPDSLQEATWSMLAKPVKGIMYHGYETIRETGEAYSYCFTNPETTRRLRHLLTDVVEPLGPMLLKLPRAEPEVAVLESFTTAAMGGACALGWSSPHVTFLQRARLDPRVIYEDEIRACGLDGVKVLYMPQCSFLTPDVIAAVKAFQTNGGILVADGQCVKSLVPDVLVPVQRFPTVPKSDHRKDVDALSRGLVVEKARKETVERKVSMLKDAAELRAALRSRFSPSADSSDGDLVVYSRRWKDVPYLCVVNDRREFGDYVGQWGLAMEKGQPHSGTVSVKDDGRKIAAAYELSRGGKVPFARNDGLVSVPVSFDTNDGRLFVFLPDEITSLKVDAPKSVSADGSVHVDLQVCGRDDAPIHALLPVEVRLFDAKGTEIDGGGWFCAEDGAVSVRLMANIDDPQGAYTLVCRDRASGLKKVLVIMSVTGGSCI